MEMNIGRWERFPVNSAADAAIAWRPAHLLERAPSWLGSALLHVIVGLVLCQMPWQFTPPEDKNTNVVLKPPKPDPVEPDRPPPPPQVPPEYQYTKLPEDEVDTPGVLFPLDEPFVDLPRLKEIRPDEHPPLAIRKIALGTDGANGHIHGLYGCWGPADLRQLRRKRNPNDPQILPGMAWLARAQESDGHWDSQKWGANHNCDGGVTGLAILAFLGHGDTDRDSKYAPNVRRGLEWLQQRQTTDGSFGERFYTQGICTMAVCEAFALSGNPRWKQMAQRAVDYCCANQNANGGWDYAGNNPARVDTSVTGWVVMGIKAGVTAGLYVPDGAVQRIKKWLEESVNPDGTTGYTKTIGAQGSSPGTPAMTAAATLCRQFMGWTRHRPEMRSALAYLARQGPGVGPNCNLYYTYYATLAMFQAGEALWNNWEPALVKPLVDMQVKGRGLQFDGSWDTATTYGPHGGRVYTTAMAVFILETPNRFLRILQ